MDKQATWDLRSRPDAVALRDAYKNYGTTSVLRRLSMTVKEGTIYGLLGASGCGKTTLLSCLVGRRKLDKGQVWVLGGRPGSRSSGVPGHRVGYMPQDVALYVEFSITEMMCYFGRIHGMSSSQIREKTESLVQFLQLPGSNRIIKSLSGGQQRRVSLAVALLHDPELLILDEPTVGVDPLLRQKIWTHLLDMASTGRHTVIITTHYIEEARQAHTIGLMRSGRLLAEDSPRSLLQMHQCESLEDAFLSLCLRDCQLDESLAIPSPEQPPPPDFLLVVGKQALGKGYSKDDDGIIGLTFHKSSETLINDGGGGNRLHHNGISGHGGRNGHNGLVLVESEKGSVEDMRDNIIPRVPYGATRTCGLSAQRLCALMLKNMLRMWHNIGFVLFIFLLPVSQVILFCVAIGRNPTGMPLGVVNHEFLQQPICHPYDGCAFVNLSCRFLHALDADMIHLHAYADEELAADAVRRGDTWGFVVFPANYSDNLLLRTSEALSADNDTIQGSILRVRLDMSNQQIAFTLQRTLLLAFRSYIRNLLHGCDFDPELGDIPVKFDEPIFGSNAPLFMEFMAPGIIVSIIFFLSVALTGAAFIMERREGMLDRTWVSGVTPTEVVLAHLVAQYVVMAGQTALVLVFMILIFHVPALGPVGWVVALTLLQGTCGMAFGFLISATCKEERTAMQVALGTFYPSLLLSGTVWPLEGMPMGLRYVSYALPSTFSTDAMRSLLARGWGIEHRVVWPGFLVTIAWTLIFLLLTWVVIKKKQLHK